MIINYNTEQLSRIIEDIFSLTGISISVCDSDYNVIVSGFGKQEYCALLQTIPIENKNCIMCDRKNLERCRLSKKPESYLCRTGLYEFVMPIIKYNTIVGFVMMGQVRSDLSPSSARYIPSADDETQKKLRCFFTQTPFFSEKKLEALYDLLPRILFDSAIDIVHDSFIDTAVKFIDTHLSEQLTVKRLCDELFCTKNHLYSAFDKHLGTTVTEYINLCRIGRAKDLLSASDMSVFDIAEAVGMHNHTYFCKLFKKLSGITPTEFRKG